MASLFFATCLKVNAKIAQNGFEVAQQVAVSATLVREYLSPLLKGFGKSAPMRVWRNW